MRRTLVSMVIGVVLACTVFWVMDGYNVLRRAADIAELQAQGASDWLEISPVQMTDGRVSPNPVEPVATWTAEAKRLIEVRAAISTRDLRTGEPTCLGGTATVIAEISGPRTYSRALSRLAGVDRCDWPPGEYRSRITWTMTDPITRVVKTTFQETPPFKVLP